MKKLLTRYKVLKGQNQFIKLIFANVVNRLGDSIDSIAFTWLVYELTHSVLWSTIIFGANILPTIIVQPFAGALVEKMNKKWIMVYCDFSRGFLVAFIAFAYANSILNPWILLAITLLNSAVESLRVPAGIAIVPSLLNKDSYGEGLALNASLSRMMELVGLAIAGFIIGLLGIAGAILIDAVTFFLSGIVIMLIKYKHEVNSCRLSIKTYIVSLKEGIAYIKIKPVIITLCLIAALLNFTMVPLNSFLPAYIAEVLMGGSEYLSILSIGLMVGAIIGSFSYPIIDDSLSKRNLMIITLSFIALFYAGLIIIPNIVNDSTVVIILMELLFIAMGIITGLVGTFASVALSSKVEPEYLARAGGVFNAFATLTIPFISVLLSIALSFADFKMIMIGFGFISAFVAVLCVKWKSLSKLDD